MTRKEVLAKIKQLGLRDKILSDQGINYTNVKTDILLTYLPAQAVVIKDKEIIETDCETEDRANKLENAVLSFLITLEQKGLLERLLAKIM